MKLKGIEFGRVFAASGTLNNFGEGWEPYHSIKKKLSGFDFEGSTFISKTSTIDSRMGKKKGEQGNLILNETTLQPVSLFPDCIKVNWINGEVFNAVGLSNPGFAALLRMGYWQEIMQRFFISYMATRLTKKDRLEEDEEFVRLLLKELPKFKTQVGVQLNISCPNMKGDLMSFVYETSDRLKVLSRLNLPTSVKINVLTPIEAVQAIIDGGNCDAIEIPNTLPYGERPDVVNWRKKSILGSPLSDYGGGGYSGRENFLLAADWIDRARRAGIDIPIICGAVFDFKDIDRAYDVGASGVAFARLSIVRPHRVKSIIEYGNYVFRDR